MAKVVYRDAFVVAARITLTLDLKFLTLVSVSPGSNGVYWIKYGGVNATVHTSELADLIFANA